jgi:hypothetical protein
VQRLLLFFSHANIRRPEPRAPSGTQPRAAEVNEASLSRVGPFSVVPMQARVTGPTSRGAQPAPHEGRRDGNVAGRNDVARRTCRRQAAAADGPSAEPNGASSTGFPRRGRARFDCESDGPVHLRAGCESAQMGRYFLDALARLPAHVRGLPAALDHVVLEAARSGNDAAAVTPTPVAAVVLQGIGSVQSYNLLTGHAIAGA